MLEAAMYTTIKTLWELGHNKSEIARTTGHDWKTVDKVVNDIKKGYQCSPYKRKRKHPRPPIRRRY